MYQQLRPWLFRFDAETIHNITLSTLSQLSEHPGALRLCELAFKLDNEALNQKCFGLNFPNPIILAAGLDKHALATPVWQHLGFGGVEIGSITALAQEGNPKPRLFRLKEDEGIINRFGFNNDGADAIAARLQRQRAHVNIPLGINIGKSKLAPLDKATDDYLYSLERLWQLADYLVINISSPNTEGLRTLQDKAPLDELLGRLSAFLDSRKPLLVKIAPDLSPGQLDDIIELVKKHRLSGVIATNTTLSREGLTSPLAKEVGGLSGQPLNKRSKEVLAYVASELQDVPIISVGGVSDAEDVYQRLALGASLVQIYTSYIYQGPMWLKRLNQGLLDILHREGLKHLSELRPKR